MFDIKFWMKMYDILKNKKNIDFSFMKKMCSKTPIIYNIETTNACLHSCLMCPRTTKMTRPIKTMKIDIFQKIVEQISPHTEEQWKKWELFCSKEYNVKKDDMSENHFFLYIIPQTIQLHGYGDELLNKNIEKFVKILTNRGFKSYFSCNPSNINLDKVEKCFENGLSYIKFSIESVNDKLQKKIRGKETSFKKSYDDICKLLDIKKEKKYSTNIIVTMLDFNDNYNKQEAEFTKLKDYFKNKDVYIYKKSLDTQWYMNKYHPNKSIHWNTPCLHPWMSMTVKSNGDVAMCMEDYNNEIVLGNVKEESLYNIWNGEKYNQFRMSHFKKSNNKCWNECDMKLIGDCFV